MIMRVNNTIAISTNVKPFLLFSQPCDDPARSVPQANNGHSIVAIIKPATAQMVASPKICVPQTESMVGWLMIEAAPRCYLSPSGWCAAPILSMARHHPSGENTLWPDITQPTTRRNRRLKMQRSNPMAIHRNQGGSADNDGTS